MRFMSARLHVDLDLAIPNLNTNNLQETAPMEATSLRSASGKSTVKCGPFRKSGIAHDNIGECSVRRSRSTTRQTASMEPSRSDRRKASISSAAKASPVPKSLAPNNPDRHAPNGNCARLHSKRPEISISCPISVLVLSLFDVLKQHLVVALSWVIGFHLLMF